tara:strand:+ start:1457 stop:3073 length:1617 start_codon:yes stop_codon:yes gene_type:complete
MVNNKKNIIFIGFSSLIVIYRYFWSTISQWREDQATNVWLALTESVQSTPVGLLSSKDIPVTNGMIIFAKIFNFIDNLLIATLLFSIFQIFCFYLLVSQLEINENKKFSLLILLSVSTVLSSSSVEFWNQWIFILFNCLFFYCYLLFLKSKEAFYLLVMLLISTLPAAFHLSGILNTTVMGIIIFYEFFSVKEKNSTRNSILKYSVLSFLALLYSYFVWFKYFKFVSLTKILSFTDLTLYDRVNILSDKFLEIPGLFLTAWTKQGSFYILQVNRDIVSNLTFNLFKVYVESHKLITVLFLFSLGLIFIYKKKNFEPLVSRFITALLFFIGFCSLVSPVLGGPDFTDFQRMDTYIQYYPLFLILWFLVIDEASEIKIRYINLKKAGLSVLVFSILLNLTLSIGIIYENINYSGNKLTEADVPLVEKIDVTKYIAEDMNKKQIKTASMSYQLGGGIWDWIPDHSEVFSKWYPQYPYTIGRVYDYMLLNEYSINNEYEGLNSRDFQNSDYIVSYILNEPELDSEENYTNILFNRLRLSIRK